MRVLRFQQKPSENRIGIMVDSARFAELGTSKNSEPILEFLKTQRERPKQTRRSRRRRSKSLTQEKRIRRESSTSTRSPFSLLSHAQQRSSAWAGTSPTISKKDQQAFLLSQYHFSNHQPH